MKKLILFIFIIAIACAGYYYRAKIKDYAQSSSINKFIFKEEKIQRVPTKIARNFPPKEVEIFTIGRDFPTLTLQKTGTSSSSKVAYIIPQISGKLTSLNVKVGDKVKKGELLATLGDCLGTNISDIQYNLAANSANLADKSAELTLSTTSTTYETAKNGLMLSKKSYLNSISSKSNSEKILNTQIENTEIGVDTAKKAYNNSKDNYEIISDTLEDLEDKYDDLENTLPKGDPALTALEGQIKTLEAQKDNLKFAKEAAKNTYEQAQLGLDQLQQTADSQLDQLDFAVEAAYHQYISVANQFAQAYYGGELQKLGSESGILQADSTLAMATQTIDAKNIKTPIEGVVTQINSKEDNFVAPGQVFIKIENPHTISVKTSVNKYEAALLIVGQKVEIQTESSQNLEGEVVSISPVLNEATKKIDVEIEIPENTEIIPGELLKVNFEVQPIAKIFIPLNSVHIEENKKYVNSVNEMDKVEKIEVKTGEIIGDYVEIKEGIPFGTKIIKDLSVFVKEGEKVALK